MSDHSELADQREQELDKLERENERIGEGADDARDALERSHKDELVPEALGEDDPAHGNKPGEDPEEPTKAEQPEAEYPSGG